MPGLASWQLNPSRLPLPVQFVFPHETSFSRSTLTHLVLLHWLSLEQKQPPAAVHMLVALLQWPNGHDVNPLGCETGQPPSGQGAPASGPDPQTEFAQGWPGGQAEPQPPQLFESELVSEQVPLQLVGAFAGQLDTQPGVPASSGAHRPASPPQALPQVPQLDGAVGLAQPPSHESCPAAHPPASPSPESSPGGGFASSTMVDPSVVSTCSSPGCGWTLASHPSSPQSPVE